MKRLTGKTALVTGGSRGIGRSIVDRFLLEGANVITCGRSERPEDLPGSVYWVQSDIADAPSVESLVATVSQIVGNLDILVNNAGVQIEKSLTDTTDEDWDTLMGCNARGMFMLCRAFIPRMQSGGCIINMGSISGMHADPGLALYNASKAFVHGLTRSLAVDHGPEIRCNAICPGWIMTAMADAAFAVADDPVRAEQDAVARHAVGRLGKPEDISATAAWLASDEAAFVTGQLITVDGGLTAASPLQPALF